MKFSEQRHSTQEELGTYSITDYLSKYLHEENVNRMVTISDKYVCHLFEDISNTELPFDFRAFLKINYDDSNNYAGDCVKLSYYSKNLYPRDIKYWTEGALKCFDTFLITYIQDICNEKIRKNSSWVKETDVYEHLINKGGTAQDIGQCFKNIYHYRSKFYHVQQLNSEGQRTVIRTSNTRYNKFKTRILETFKQALEKFEVLNITATIN